MAEGDSTFEGLAVPLYGESEIQQQDVDYDVLTLTGAADNTSNLFVCQDSDGTESFRIYPYGRTRIIRTDAESRHTYINALDVVMEIDYAAGASQCYAGGFKLDTSGGSSSGGRESVLHLQYSGNAVCKAAPASNAFINLTDLNATYEMDNFVSFLGVTPDSGGCFETNTCATATHGINIRVNNVKYWIMCADVSDN